MRIATIAMLVGVLPVLPLAATTGEEDKIVINRLNATDFEVIQGMNFGAAEYWCGAATYIERRTGQSELTPIYVKRPRGPSLTMSGRKGVVFSTSTAGIPAQGTSRQTLTVQVRGAMLKSVQARRYCRDAFTRSTK
ncbi:MAG: hypothetical protein AB8B60_04040 [Sulfitobacter sp.]